ncbi:MAG: SPOR domain-containing protein [Cytophagales bacterium]|nr:SPOR domain-containing protein [Cytophagales bacterium]
MLGCSSGRASTSVYREDLNWLWTHTSPLPEEKSADVISEEENTTLEFPPKPIDPAVDMAVIQRVSQNKKKGVRGYVVQFYNGPDRKQAEKILIKLKRYFQTNSAKQWNAYVRYKQPYYKVRVGFFSTYLEAYKICYPLRSEFSGMSILLKKDVRF